MTLQFDDVTVKTIYCLQQAEKQIAQVNHLFQLLNLVRIYGHGSNELSRLLMRKNVSKQDVSEDTPIV